MMREMKDSGIPWIGEIPKEWTIELIGNQVKEVNNPNTDGLEDNALQFKMGTIISKSRGDSKYNPETLEGYNIVDKGVIMLNGLNLSFDLISQRVGLVRERGVITSTYLAVKPTKNIDSEYLTYLFKAYDNCKAFHSMGRGLRQTLSYGELRKYLLLYPSLEEQQRIAEFLDRKCAEVDEMIGLQEQIIEELKAYKQSVITEAVTKGLKPDVPMKDSGIEWIGEIPEHWRIGKIKMIAKTNSGSTPKTISQTEESSIVWIRTTDINDNLVTDSSLHLTQEELNSASCPMLNKDVCVVAMYGGGGTIGKCGILGIEATINQALCSIEVKSFHLGAFMFWTLRATRYNWMKFAVGTRKDPNISQEIVRNYIVPIPPIEEQQKISDYLNTKCTEIDNLISIKQSKIDSLKEYKKSIIYEYVTGKKEVE